MAAESSIAHQASKLNRKISGSISRRSKLRRGRSGKKCSSDGSVSITSCSSCSESLDIHCQEEESSIGESYNTPASCEPIEEEIMKLTVDVPTHFYCGDYRTISQNEFFMECFLESEGNSVVHFFNENDPDSIELDMMMRQMARKFTTCKFLRINSADTNFVCKRLKIHTFPTVLAIRNKVVMNRLTNFEGLQEDFENWVTQSMSLMNRR